MTTTIAGRVPYVFESTSQRMAYIHSNCGLTLNDKAEWLPRPLQLADEHGWPTREAAESFIAANADGATKALSLDEMEAVLAADIRSIEAGVGFVATLAKQLIARDWAKREWLAQPATAMEKDTLTAEDAPTTYEWLQSIGLDAGVAKVDEAELTIWPAGKSCYLEHGYVGGNSYIEPGCSHRIDLPYPETRRDVLDLLEKLGAKTSDGQALPPTSA